MMSDKLTDDSADPAASFAMKATKSGELKSQSTPAVKKDHSQKAIKSLLATADHTLEEDRGKIK
jgi:hypothetical protein